MILEDNEGGFDIPPNISGWRELLPPVGGTLCPPDVEKRIGALFDPVDFGFAPPGAFSCGGEPPSLSGFFGCRDIVATGAAGVCFLVVFALWLWWWEAKVLSFLQWFSVYHCIRDQRRVWTYPIWVHPYLAYFRARFPRVGLGLSMGACSAGASASWRVKSRRAFGSWRGYFTPNNSRYRSRASRSLQF